MRDQLSDTCGQLRQIPIANDLKSKSETSSSVGAGPRARPRFDLEKGAHGEAPLQTNSKIADESKSPEGQIHESSQPEFTTVDDTHRIIVSTTANWSAHAEDALRDQHPPVTKIDLNDLEASQIDWSRYQPTKPAPLKAKKLLRPHQESAVKLAKAGLQTADRGKLIMACGTGKTFTALEAYDYVVNGKSALDWVVERQCVKTDKDSGIVNDANAWAVETMGNGKYPLELFMRVITVSFEPVKIVRGLPGLEIG